jgi:hypothetical protein
VLTLVIALACALASNDAVGVHPDVRGVRSLAWTVPAGRAPKPLRTASGTASAALARLRALTGDWHGTFEWTGARQERGEMGASYHSTGRDSAVVESLTSGGEPVMTSVYHLDGEDLRVTHYCAAGNQPRLKAARIDLASGSGEVDFEIVDATNLRSKDAPHVASIRLRLVDDDNLVIRFGFVAAGARSEELVTLERVRRAGAAPPGRRGASAAGAARGRPVTR